MSEIDSDFLLVVQFDIRLDNRIGNPFTRHRTKISVHTHIAPEMLAETDVCITAIVGRIKIRTCCEVNPKSWTQLKGSNETNF